MARIDDYQQARDMAATALGSLDLADIARRSGFDMIDPQQLSVPFLTRTYRVAYPGFVFTDMAGPAAQIPLQEQVLLLHYLQGCQPRLAGRWIAYREIPGASFYFGAFVKRAVEPLKKVFGQNLEGFRQAAARLDALGLDEHTTGFRLNVLPYAPLQVIVWEGDEEFPAEANILFDATAGEYLSPEDAAWLASLTVYRLMALAK
jgi:hypothetical protein